MFRIFGKNNNNLFRKSQKTTFSMPQLLPFEESILKCACGFDYVAIITQAGELYFLFQSKFYFINNLPFLFDIATAENTVTLLTKDRDVYVWDFDESKIVNNSVHPTKIRLTLEQGDYVQQVQMGAGDIFLLTEAGKVYHFKRNQWYETKSYSNIQSIQLSQRIIEVSSGYTSNLFLTYQGLLFKSSKQDPLHLTYVQTDQKFIKIASGTYNTGITKKGTIMIWGNSIHGSYQEPTEFSKLTKKFIDIKLQRENGYALSDDGEVWVWGLNSNGELGLSDYQSRIKPFPLITLEKKFVLQVFCGPSYACCICSPEQKDDKKMIKVLNRKTTEFNSVRQQERKIRNYEFKKDHIYVEDENYEIQEKDSSFHIQKRRKQSKSFDKKSHSKKGSQHPLSPISKNKNTKVDKKSQIKQKEKTLNGHQKKNSWSINQKDKMQLNQKQYEIQQLHSQLISIKQQNISLKQKLKERQQIISDITDKIRLLEQAIEQHQRNLTSRDHVLHEYQIKEQQYISHIDELQKTIDQIVRYKQKNNQVMVIYEDLKVNFEKQRGFYTEKIKQYEIRINQQKQKFKEEIQSLQRKLMLKETKNKQNSKPEWESHSPIAKKYQVPYFKGEFCPGQKNAISSVDNVIDQIESNKSRITKSANKLIAMLDISQ